MVYFHVGTILGDFQIDGGGLALGISPGQTIIQGDYTQGMAASLDIELQGMDPGVDFDQLIVSNVATLCGTLQIETGFTPNTDPRPGMVGTCF